jgi:hypothetical protein
MKSKYFDDFFNPWVSNSRGEKERREEERRGEKEQFNIIVSTLPCSYWHQPAR